jgi:glycosyltransferase involved in cell wall biosynthesis
MSKTIVVVPCYNEANRLNVEAFKAFAAAHRDIRFLFVDDGSRDRTREVIDRLAGDDPEAFAAMGLEKNGGKAEAVRHGIVRALEADPDYVAFWDADLATPLQTIIPFRDLMESRPEIEMTIGSRVKLLGRAIDRRPIRHYLGRIAATLASWTLGLSVYDTQCGAKMFRATPEIAHVFAEPFLTHWIFDIEIIARLIRYRRDHQLPGVEEIIYEMPLPEWRDVRGSKVKGGDFLTGAMELFVIRRRYLSR